MSIIFLEQINDNVFFRYYLGMNYLDMQIPNYRHLLKKPRLLVSAKISLRTHFTHMVGNYLNNIIVYILSPLQVRSLKMKAVPTVMQISGLMNKISLDKVYMQCMITHAKKKCFNTFVNLGMGRLYLILQMNCFRSAISSTSISKTYKSKLQISRFPSLQECQGKNNHCPITPSPISLIPNNLQIPNPPKRPAKHL